MNNLKEVFLELIKKNSHPEPTKELLNTPFMHEFLEFQEFDKEFMDKYWSLFD